MIKLFINKVRPNKIKNSFSIHIHSLFISIYLLLSYLFMSKEYSVSNQFRRLLCAQKDNAGTSHNCIMNCFFNTFK